MKVAALSGGVGGARMLRGLAGLDGIELTAIVNIGDDESIYGLDVSPDVDTVIYTLARREGRQGWGLDGDSYATVDALGRFPIDTWFRIGDSDLATNLFRTARLGDGWTLSQVTTAQAAVFGLQATILPASDDPVRTEVHVPGEGWLAFQTYFVDRHHASPVDDVRFDGAWAASPAPGVIDAIRQAEVVVIGPSNPPLSIWPILSIGGIADAISDARRVVAVSPLFGGRPLKGPADTILRGLGLPDGTEGIITAYEGLLDELVVDVGDETDASLGGTGLDVYALPTRISDPERAIELAAKIIHR